MMLRDEIKPVKLLGALVFIIGSVVGKLHLSRVIVPSFKMIQETARLECPFELGADRLYSVTWYKDNEEFFRYKPRFRPAIQIHPVDGVTVVMEGSDQKFVTLGRLDLSSTGVYRCEVSGEGPVFDSVSAEGRMTVVYLPKEGPQITGKTRDEYETGEYLALNCTSAHSFPPARLSWFINDIPIEHGVWQTRPQNPTGHIPPLQVEQSESTLNISLGQDHFNENGDAKVRCVATISTMFWQDGVERTVGNSRKPVTDFTFTRSNSFNNVASAPVFHDDREASLLVRGGSNQTTVAGGWVVNLGVFLAIICSHFLLVIHNTHNNHNKYFEAWKQG